MTIMYPDSAAIAGPAAIVGSAPDPNSPVPIPLVITYTDPDGFIWNLSDVTMTKGPYPKPDGTTGYGGYVCSGISGIEGVPVMIQGVPLLDGTTIVNTYIPQTGTIGLAVLLGRPPGASQNDYYSLLDAFVRAFLHRRNEVPAPGILTITRPNGQQRSILVYTSSGLNTPEVGMNEMTLYSLSLSTPDPYWYDSNVQYRTFQSVSAPGIIAPGILPISLGGPDIIGDSVIFNQGNALTYPIWTITGPGTPTIKNNTTGRSWALNTAVPAGQQVQVNTARGQQGVVNLTTKANIWSQLVFTGPHDLWPFVGGSNAVNVALAGSTAASSVVLQYTQKWSRA